MNKNDKLPAALSHTRMIQTIATLAAALEATENEARSLDQAAASAVEISADLAVKVENLEDQLSDARHVEQSLRDSLERQRQQYDQANAGDYKKISRGQLMMAVMLSPERFMQAILWLRGPESKDLWGQKIAQIKRVREIGGYGLKEAKDLVEAFYDYPTTTPDAGPLPAVSPCGSPIPTAHATAE